MNEETLIDLLRHGEPEGGRAYRGHRIDDPLSETGWQQMWTAVGNHKPWEQIISSPLQRCQAFAQALGERYNIPVDIESEFKEVGFGAWEGKTPLQLQENNLKAYENFYRDPIHCRPAGAEPLEDFIKRVTQAYETLLTKCANQHVLVVAHAGVIRAIIANVLCSAPIGMYKIKVNNAGITRIRHGKQGSILEYHNASMNSINQ